MRYDRVVVYEKNLTRIHEWIRSVDQKLGVFFALQAAFIVFVTPLILEQLSKNFLKVSSVNVLIIIFGYLLISYGLLKCIHSLYSRLKVKNTTVTEDQLSVTYFAHIKHLSHKSYVKKMKSMSKKDYGDELLSQIHESARIATKKHEQFNDALRLFAVGGFFTIISLMWLYLI